MSQITIRGIKPEVERKIRRISKTTGKSLNRVIQEIIYEYTGFNRAPQNRPADSLKKLAGGWSDKDAAEFIETIKSCDQVDEKIWE